jgi:geranylgeranyl reductase family protein
MLDCIIIGAGPAGATAAYHLAKKGRSVIVFDRASLPRYKPCGGGVSPAIKQWFDFDLTPAIDNTIDKVRYTWKLDDPVEADLSMLEPMWMVKRDRFDHFLCQQAQQQGAQIEDNTEVTAIAFQSEHWDVTTSKGTYQAKYLIAADGVRGKTAQWLGFLLPESGLGATLEVRTPVSANRQHIASFDFGAIKNGYIWNFPKADGYTISAGCFKGKIKPEELKKQIFNYALASNIDVSNAQYYEYPLSVWTEKHPLHTRQAVVVGEAAGIADPLIGEGIRPAILTGVRAAEAIDRALAGDGKALAQYSEIIDREWGVDMVLAQRLAGLFYQFTQLAYKVGVKRPAAAQIMGKILCGKLRYSSVVEQAMQILKKSLLPGFGR